MGDTRPECEYTGTLHRRLKCEFLTKTRLLIGLDQLVVFTVTVCLHYNTVATELLIGLDQLVVFTVIVCLHYNTVATEHFSNRNKGKKLSCRYIKASFLHEND